MGREKRIKPFRHIVWSTDEIDLNDPFQRQWYIRQVLLRGRTEDIRTLDLNEVARLLTTWTCHQWPIICGRNFLKKKQHVER